MLLIHGRNSENAVHRPMAKSSRATPVGTVPTAERTRNAVSKIEWTDKTWNPWWGCDKIAPECGLAAPGNPRPEGGGCYAAIFASRGLHSVHLGVAAKGEWTGLITRAGPAMWQAPFKYPRGTLCFLLDVRFLARAGAARVAGRSPRCDRGDAVGHLPSIDEKARMATRRLAALNRHLPRNVWAGATVGHPKSLPLLKPLRRIEAAKRFLSVEPLLAPMMPGLDLTDIDWVIGGGESPGPGHPARPCDPDWMRAVRDFASPTTRRSSSSSGASGRTTRRRSTRNLPRKPRVGRPLTDDFGASFLYDLSALCAIIFFDLLQQFLKIELLFCRFEIGPTRNLSIGTYHQGKCFRVVGRMDHVVHDRPPRR